MLVLATSSAAMRVCDAMLPALSQAFGVTTGQAALTVSGYAIAYGLLQVVFGPLGDRWGKRRVIGYAALGCVAGNALALLATQLNLLVAARVLAGATAGGIIPLVLAWVGDTVAYEERQAVLARFMTASLLGMIAGQWLSGVLTDWLGWRTVFGLLTLLFAVTGLAIVRHPDVRAEPVRPPQREGPWHAMAQVLALPWARRVVLMVAAEGAFAFSAMAFLPAFLVHTFGLRLSAAAGIVALYGAGGLAYAFAARRLVQRLGESGLALAGGLLLATAWLTLVVAPSWMLALPAAATAGLGFYSLHGVMQIHGTQMAPAMRGTAMGLFASALFLGISAGVAGAAVVVDHVGFRALFAGCGIALGGLGVVFATLLRQRSQASR